METDKNRELSPKEAHRMLNSASEAEHQTRNPPLPWSFFIVQALLLAVICSAQTLPPPASRAIAIVGVIAVIGVGIRSVFYRPGYGVVLPDGPAAVPYMIALFVTVGIPAALATGFELWWLWLVAALFAAATTLEMGRRYRKAVGHG